MITENIILEITEIPKDGYLKSLLSFKGIKWEQREMKISINTHIHIIIIFFALMSLSMGKERGL